MSDDCVPSLKLQNNAINLEINSNCRSSAIAFSVLAGSFTRKYSYCFLHKQIANAGGSTCGRSSIMGLIARKK